MHPCWKHAMLTFYSGHWAESLQTRSTSSAVCHVPMAVCEQFLQFLHCGGGACCYHDGVYLICKGAGIYMNTRTQSFPSSEFRRMSFTSKARGWRISSQLWIQIKSEFSFLLLHTSCFFPILFPPMWKKWQAENPVSGYDWYWSSQPH